MPPVPGSESKPVIKQVKERVPDVFPAPDQDADRRPARLIVAYQTIVTEAGEVESPVYRSKGGKQGTKVEQAEIRQAYQWVSEAGQLDFV